jgi:hypothetical protein
VEASIFLNGSDMPAAGTLARLATGKSPEPAGWKAWFVEFDEGRACIKPCVGPKRKLDREQALIQVSAASTPREAQCPKTQEAKGRPVGGHAQSALDLFKGDALESLARESR